MSDPLVLLREFDARYRARAARLPQQRAPEAPWLGIGFLVGGYRLVAAMTDIDEVLVCPPLTRVPGAQPWLRGIANVRGNLLPVADLKALLLKGTQPVGRRSRVLVLRREGLYSGVLVEQVLGMKRFAHATREPPVAGPLKSWVTGSYTEQDERFLIFDVARLAASPLFLQAAG